MKHLKTYSKLFESVIGELQDILLDINDEPIWSATSWSNINNDKFYVTIETVDEDEEYELEGQTLPPVVIECIKRTIDFMNGEGFTNYCITFEEESESYKMDDDISDIITLDDLSNLDVWPSSYIRIEFWK